MTTTDNIFRCPIHGSIDVTGDELRVIGHPYFQRLRHISQLGLAHYVFPGATHSRFSHSLGTMHLAGLVFNRLERNGFPPLSDFLTKEELRYLLRVFRLAALLHDLGHMPFSHVFESEFGPVEDLTFPVWIKPLQGRIAKHEDYSMGMILAMAEDSRIPFDKDEAWDICALISGEPAKSSFFCDRGKPVFQTLQHLISSEIDVDRMDYLLRDSYFTGTPYGKFDLEHILRSLYAGIDEKNGCARLILNHNAVTTYENFLMARSHMFTQVYFHKTLQTLAFFLRSALREGEITCGSNASLEEFCDYDEHLIFSQILAQKGRRWSSKIISRETWQVVHRDIKPAEDRNVFWDEQLGRMKKEGFEPMLVRKKFGYSNQIGLDMDHPKSILVWERAFGKNLKFPIAQKSLLLRCLPKEIEITILSVEKKDSEKLNKWLHRHQINFNALSHR